MVGQVSMLKTIENLKKESGDRSWWSWWNKVSWRTHSADNFFLRTAAPVKDPRNNKGKVAEEMGGR